MSCLIINNETQFNACSELEQEFKFRELCSKNDLEELERIKNNCEEVNMKWIQNGFLDACRCRHTETMRWFINSYPKFDFDFNEAYKISILNDFYEIAEMIVTDYFYCAVCNDHTGTKRDKDFRNKMEMLCLNCNDQESINRTIKFLPFTREIFELSLLNQTLFLAKSLYEREEEISPVDYVIDSKIYNEVFEHGCIEVIAWLFSKFESQFRAALETDINENFLFYCRGNGLKMLKFLYSNFSDKIDLHYNDDIFFKMSEGNDEITEFLKSKL